MVESLHRCSGTASRQSSCYHLLGVDLFVSSDLAMHVIEVNGLPSLSQSIDDIGYRRLKRSLLHATMDVLGVCMQRGAQCDPGGGAEGVAYTHAGNEDLAYFAAFHGHSGGGRNSGKVSGGGMSGGSGSGHQRASTVDGEGADVLFTRETRAQEHRAGQHMQRLLPACSTRVHTGGGGDSVALSLLEEELLAKRSGFDGSVALQPFARPASFQC